MVFAEEECGKLFNQPSNLKRHEMIHKGVKSHECKSFYFKIELKEHESIHTGKYQFECKTCGKGFHRIGKLKKHDTIEHPLKNGSS